MDIATAADVRLCAADTKFAVKEVDIGLAADIGTLSRLPKVVGNFGWVKEVALSARVFGAEEALRVGFVSQVFGGKEEVLKGALELAGLIASKSPVAVLGTKDILNWSRDRSVEDGRFSFSFSCSWFSLVCWCWVEGWVGVARCADLMFRSSVYECVEQCCVADEGCQRGVVVGDSEEEAYV